MYNQPIVSLTPPYAAWTSDREVAGDGFGFRSYDNFSLPQLTLIDGVNWQGFYLDFVTPGNNPPAPDAIFWEISFWSDFNGQRDALLYSQTLPAANVQTTVLGTTSFDLPPPVPVVLFNFEADLPTPFLANPGTTYWLSVTSYSPNVNPVGWSWFQGTGGDGITIQEAYPGGFRFPPREGDRAFSLEGQVVPEPSTLVLLVTGLGVTLGYSGVRRQRARATS